MGINDETCAVIVAIEEYAGLGEKWKLTGAGEQAAEFAHWLLDERGLGLPKDHVHAFVNGSAAERFRGLGFREHQISPPTSGELNPFFANIGKHFPEGAKTLLLYWVGHGVVARGNVRRLLVGDASTQLKTNMDVDELANLLRSAAAGSFVRQFAFLDACGQFFESLQSTTNLPRGGLNENPLPRTDVRQYFYFASSSGQYASTGLFGPEVLKILKAPQAVWPPEPRNLRNQIESVFDQLLSQHKGLNQQPIWLEYSAESGERSNRGELPTIPDIHAAAERAGFPLYQLRRLTEIAVSCRAFGEREMRDRLVRQMALPREIHRREEYLADAHIDLMRIVAGAIEQESAEKLAEEVIRIEGNSDAAVRFESATRKVHSLRRFWSLLAATKLPLRRAQVLFQKAHRYHAEGTLPRSMDEVVATLLDLPGTEEFVEFLLRASRERPDDPYCKRLEDELGNAADMSVALARAAKRLDLENASQIFLLAEVGQRSGDSPLRITKASLWSASAKRRDLAPLEEQGDLAHDVAALLEEAREEAQACRATVVLELLVPDELLCMGPGSIAYDNRGISIDPELNHPVTLRWLNRMQASPRNLNYKKGLWKKTAAQIEDRTRGQAARAAWLTQETDIATFCRTYGNDPSGELIGFPFFAEGRKLIGSICECGLPYACWPRHAKVDLGTAQRSVEDVIGRGFRDLPHNFGACRNNVDLLLLWDDPRRNPYESQMTEPK